LAEVRKVVEEVLSAEGEEAEVVKDVLRALAIFHGVLWESELLEDIMKVRDYQLPYVPSPDKLKRAVDKLASLGLVEVEERTRGSIVSPATYTDRLIKIKNLVAVKNALLHDSVYMRALNARARALREAMK